MNRSNRGLILAILAAAVLAGGLVVFRLPLRLAWSATDSSSTRDARYEAAVKHMAELGPQIKAVQAMSDVVNAVSQLLEPSVVHIQSERTAAAPALPNIPPELRRFFGDDDDGSSPFHSPSPREQLIQATGSGVIVTSDGYVLTNNHVVAGSTKVIVTLPGASDGDGHETYDAKVIGADPKTDVAIIKIDGAKNLHPAELGDSDKVRVGDFVLAFGSPFGLDRTVTLGIISAKGRANVGITDYEDFIQTDASINPGNSGGPLVDVTGRVIGMNTAIASRSGGNQGVGFAIPVNLIKQLLPRLEKGEQIRRGYLGVLIQPLDKKLADSFGFDSTHGAVVTQILPDSPSKDVLKQSDIVFSVNGDPVKDPNELRTAVANVGPGKEVKLGVFRDGKKLDVTIKLGELPNTASVAGAHGAAPGQATSKEVLGIDVQTLTAELAKQLGYEDQKGVVVTSVEASSDAAREGVAVGDLITEVGNTPVKTVEQFMSALDKAKAQGKTVRLLVTSRVARNGSGGGSRFVVLPFKK